MRFLDVLKALEAGHIREVMGGGSKAGPELQQELPRTQVGLRTPG